MQSSIPGQPEEVARSATVARQQARTSSPKPKVYSKYPLPSERHPFGTHFEILSRFVTHSRNGNEPVAADKIEGGPVPVQAAQMNVRFLTSVGLLRFDSKGLYVPTPEAIRLVNARTVSEDRARPIMRSLVQSSWFAEVAMTTLKSTPLVTEETLVGELALAAETNREKKGPALKVLVDYLLWSGVISKDERGLSLVEQTTAQSAPPTGGPPIVAPGVSTDLVPDRRPGGSTPSGPQPSGWHVVQTEDFFLKVRSDPVVVDEVRDQLALLRKKIDRLRSASTSPESTEESPSGLTPP